ncbi:hypothetical protein, partial [Streptomyces sp. NPDC006333]|uniref:hypothetical protein n=1 Tax=Streptomyces sp. NPDC006333 TaxID=3156753 RepID=UPI0033B0CF2C
EEDDGDVHEERRGAALTRAVRDEGLRCPVPPAMWRRAESVPVRDEALRCPAPSVTRGCAAPYPLRCGAAPSPWPSAMRRRAEPVPVRDETPRRARTVRDETPY